MLIQNLAARLGKRYGVGTLERGARQYMDGEYVRAIGANYCMHTVALRAFKPGA